MQQLAVSREGLGSAEDINAHLCADSQALFRPARNITRHMHLLCLSVLIDRNQNAPVPGLPEVQCLCTQHRLGS